VAKADAHYNKNDRFWYFWICAAKHASQSAAINCLKIQIS